MFMGLKIWLWTGASVLVLLAVFYWYFQHSQQQLAAQAAELMLRQQQVQQMQQQVQNLQLQHQQQQQVQQRLSTRTQAAQAVVQQMQQQLRPVDPDTGYIQSLGSRVLHQPSAFEDLVNLRTREQLRCLELLTGADLRREETNASVSNSQCQDLLDQRLRTGMPAP